MVRGEVKEIIVDSLMKGFSPFKGFGLYLKATGIKKDLELERCYQICSVIKISLFWMGPGE